MNKKLISVNNKDVKAFYQLTLKSKHRKNSKTFLIEGLREIKLAINNNWVCDKDILPFIDKCSKTKYGMYLQNLLLK